jgi:hypothetical protein
MKRLFIAIFLILHLSQGFGMNRQKTDKEKQKQTHTFIVLHTSGNVRNTRTVFIGETDTTGAREALEKFVPELSKYWKIHPDYQSADYIFIENPASFVSDLIDNYSAQRGHLVRNGKNECCFLVEYTSQKGPFSEKDVHKSEKIWGENAETILKKLLSVEHKAWPITVYSQFDTEAVKPITSGDNKREFIRVSVIYKLDK